ncbi:betaine--homocysteine S-methyltransferase 1-like [Anneissia japonica]|uniref:betaine--homocysteine S-methyltransferase 1-like n=1 Tax=Anneissia japonica TaxID=1529436 RepID=UPI001425502D|nr:betaine--homocysteine S-methyltransferase 1-like [Anneissia japonica]
MSSGKRRSKVKGLLERLNGGETVIVAEGYLFLFERRGLLKAGAYVPEVILEHPDLVRQQYWEFVHAGSDVVLAFTYYAHREKMRLIGREKDVEKMNRIALKLAREVANETGTLMAGNICNTNLYKPDDPSWNDKIMNIFKEQIEWAVEEGADYILSETCGDIGEAVLSVKAIKKYAPGLPAVATIPIYQNVIDGEVATLDNIKLSNAVKMLEDAGADVIGLNCARGPEMTMKIMDIVKENCKKPVAAVPVPYRTTDEQPNMQLLTDPKTGKRLFPENLDCAFCTRSEIYEFGKRCKQMGIGYVGICCGNSPHYTRALAESVGHTPPASRYTTDLSQHFMLGNDDSLNKHYTKDVKTLITIE